MVSKVHFGSFYGTATANVNTVDVFKEAEKVKHPQFDFNTVRKIAIEAPAKTKVTVNDVDITMPSTGMLEFGLDYVQITNLVFETDSDVNIIYMY